MTAPWQSVLIIAAILICTGCEKGDHEPAAESRPATSEAPKFRFAVFRFQHETCTFCPGGDVEVDDWTEHRPASIGDAVLDDGPYVRGFAAAAREYDGVELIGLTSPRGVYGGSSRSWNTEATFDHFVDNMLAELEAAMPVDGVYLALHGAMAVRNIPRPEAEIARRVRQVVGTEVPIVGSFDLHANEDRAFLDWADMAFVTKRYPHYDEPLQGERSLRALVRIAKGQYRPTTATRKPGIITPTVVQWTGKYPGLQIMERARRWEARESGAVVSVCFGFPWADVPDVGATVQVMTNGDQALADRIADDMNEFVWRTREGMLTSDFVMPDAAVAQARDAIGRGLGPVVLADYSDRNGDATYILQQISANDPGGVLIATLRDERVVEHLLTVEAQPGDKFDMDLGGVAGTSSGMPIRVAGRLEYLGPGMGFDNLAIVRFGKDNAVIITPALKQVMWPTQLEIGGLDPDDFDVFVVKSRVHFRRGFDETGYAKSIFIVDAPEPFIGTARLEALKYENVKLDALYPYGVPAGR